MLVYVSGNKVTFYMYVREYFKVTFFEKFEFNVPFGKNVEILVVFKSLKMKEILHERK